MKNLLLLLSILICVLTSCNNGNKADKIPESVTEKETTVFEVDKTKPEKLKSKSISELKTDLISKGYDVFEYVDEKTKDTTLMQKYFIAFLKNGPIRNQNEEEANQLQSEHMTHLSKMYELGYADISGPFDDDSDIRGITIYNVPTLQMADSLANADPMVKAGRLVIEVHPWWAAKGFPLR